MDDPKEKICPQCRTPFTCYNSGCWCNDFPLIIPIEHNKGCLCKDCLEKAVTERVQLYMSDLSEEGREKISLLGTAHKLHEGIDYYIDENNFQVFTSWYHLRRGYCCGNVCKHCPY